MLFAAYVIMPVAEKQTGLLTGFTLFDCGSVQAEGVALFIACSTENILKHVDGFAGAVMFASTCGRYAAELVFWTSPEAHATARARARAFDYMHVVEQHCHVSYVSFSTISSADVGFARRTARGQGYLGRVRRCQPLERALASPLFRFVSSTSSTVGLVALSQDGTSLVFLVRDARDTPEALALVAAYPDPMIEIKFTVVERVIAPSAGEKLPAPYHLARFPWTDLRTSLVRVPYAQR